MEKKIITSEIVENIRQSGGRFLKKVIINNNNNNNNNIHSNIDWEEVDFETSRLKVSHSFRTITKWQAEQDDVIWNQDSQQRRGNEEGAAMSDESIQSIVPEETKYLGMVAESMPSSSDAQANSMNCASSNKRRKGQNI